MLPHDKQDPNPSLEGVALKVRDGVVSIYGTDRYTLAAKTFTGMPVNSTKDFMLLTQKLAWSIGLAGKKDESLHYELTENAVIVRGERFNYLFSNLQMGKTPDYDKVLNTCRQYNNTINISKGVFERAVHGISLIAVLAKNPVEMHFKGRELILYVEDKQVGHSKIRVPFEATDDVVERLDGTAIGFRY